MNYLRPIFTEKRECQDCYKCVRRCPVKAIKVEGGTATVVPELCILCGRCVEICPSGAKRVRDDLAKARQLLGLRPRVYASLAPSFRSEFPGVPAGRLIAAFRKLGFAGVSETALGAEEVSAHVAEMLRQAPERPLLSSACPTVVAYLQKYHPERARLVTGLLSPMLAHGRLLRRHYGEEIGVVFVGPCIAKKGEADAHPELIDVALTFEDLRRWLSHERVDLEVPLETAEDRFVPGEAHEGGLYPVDGGMIAGVKAHCSVADPAMTAFSGLRSLERGLTGIERLKPEGGLFVELLACEGGCVSGPKAHRDEGIACKRYRVLRSARPAQALVPREPALDISVPVEPGPLPAPAFSEAAITEVLRSIGKLTLDDELNCGGCGYETCREFAKALLASKAERPMCVTYMRKLALKKANALLRTMPSAVVVVDQGLRILEHNDHFARMFTARSGDRVLAEMPSLEGVPLGKVVPFASLFQSVLKVGEDLLDRDLRLGESILHGSIFSIEKGCVVGGIFQDVTRPSVQKEQVIRKAREVIQKNLATVQQIAYLLGENAAESEIILDSIIESFSTPAAPDAAAGGQPEAGAGRRDDWKRLYRG